MHTDQPLRVIVIGARSVRQGTGPFIAAGLTRAGAQVAAIVGTSEQSAREAVTALRHDWGVATRAYTDLTQALEEVRPDAVAICSPWRFHAQQLQQIAQAGCHCLVEKPMAWPATHRQAAQLVDGFQSRGLLLQQVSQWPTTLPAFSRLHGGLPEKVDRFTLRLSPISIGEDMITDSAPHFISLLQALAGPGDCLNVKLTSAEERLSLHCRYQYADGAIDATLLLETCQQRPRPAWYQINDLRADRSVQLPQYTQSLVSNQRSVDLEDPMHLVTEQFVANLEARQSTDSTQLLSAHGNLLQLAAAWR